MSKSNLSKSNLKTAGLSFFIAGVIVMLVAIFNPEPKQNSEQGHIQDEETISIQVMEPEDSQNQDLPEGQARISITEDTTLESLTQNLFEVQMIPDEADFIQFMQANGYSDRLQVGEYIINQDMNIKDIAEILTGSIQTNQEEVNESSKEQENG